MFSDDAIRPLTGAKIEDFTEIFTDKKYTDLSGCATDECYIDVGKFASAMILRLQSIWETFVNNNSSEWDALKSGLSSHNVLQNKLAALNESLDAENLKKLGWYNINGNYIPSKFEGADMLSLED